MTLFLLALGGVVAFLFGIWLGMPGRVQSVEEIEERMEAGPGRRRKVKKRFVAVAWLQRQITPSLRSRERKFGIKDPEDR